MCISFPAQIQKIDGAFADVLVLGTQARKVFLACEPVTSGAWVLVNGQQAICSIDETEAKNLMSILTEASDVSQPN